MALHLHNTTTRVKEEFVSLEAGHVRMYVCGPTVYDFFHIGNARAFVVFDTLRRVLQERNYRVTYVQNITDIDDKIIRRANEEGRDPQQVAKEFTQAFLEDQKALGCRPADHQPKATEHIPDIIRLIQRIMDAGHAYVVEHDVYFSVRGFSAYGELSGKSIDQLEQGARVEVDVRKHDPLDFALWKAAKPGEPAWDSPWGPGRPGWHIECSAMSMKYLGDQFDIHGGGEDLIFPHHENENAQSQSVTGKPLARFWLHNGHLNIEGEKMSKSLGNFWIARDVLKEFNYQTVRLFLLSAHYRSPLDFSRNNLEATQTAYEEIRRMFEYTSEYLNLGKEAVEKDDPEAQALQTAAAEISVRYHQYLDDDLNTSGAIGQIHVLASRIKETIAKRRNVITMEFIHTLRETSGILRDMLSLLGIDVLETKKPQEICDLILERQEARRQKDYTRSDQLRNEIKDRNYDVQDIGPYTIASAIVEPPTSNQENLVDE